jgi:hypothetical protein
MMPTELPSAAALARVRGTIAEMIERYELDAREYATPQQQVERSADLRLADAWLELVASGDLLPFPRKLIIGRLAHLLTGAEDGTPFDWDALLPALDELRAKLARAEDTITALRGLAGLVTAMGPNDDDSPTTERTDDA